MYEKDWVVYAKRPFGGPAQALKYLARYTHRVAISNRRLLTLEDLAVEESVVTPEPTAMVPYSLNEAIRDAERRYLQEVLESVGGQRLRAAEILGISRKTLWTKMKLLGME